MQRLLGFFLVLFLFSTLATSVQALQAAPECVDQADCGEGLACDMEINQCVADEDDARLAECWSDEDCQEGEWCNFASLVGGDDSSGSGEREAQPAEEGGNEDADAQPAEETGEEAGAGAPREMSGYCQPISEESGGGDEVGAETVSEEGTGVETSEEGTGVETSEEGETGDEDSGDGSSGSGGCAVSSSGDVDRGLVLLLALAAAFALLFPRAERRKRSL